MFCVLTQSDDLSIRPRIVAQSPKEAAAEAALRLMGAGHVLAFLPDPWSRLAIDCGTAKWFSAPWTRELGRPRQAQS